MADFVHLRTVKNSLILKKFKEIAPSTFGGVHHWTWTNICHSLIWILRYTLGLSYYLQQSVNDYITPFLNKAFTTHTGHLTQLRYTGYLHVEMPTFQGSSARRAAMCRALWALRLRPRHSRRRDDGLGGETQWGWSAPLNKGGKFGRRTSHLGLEVFSDFVGRGWESYCRMPSRPQTFLFADPGIIWDV